MNPTPYDGRQVYRNTKQAQLAVRSRASLPLRQGRFAGQRRRRHPGASATNLFARQLEQAGRGLLAPVSKAVSGVLLQSAAAGALSTLRALDESTPTGAFVGPSRFGQLRGRLQLSDVYASAKEPTTAARLWELTDQVMGRGCRPDRGRPGAGGPSRTWHCKPDEEKAAATGGGRRSLSLASERVRRAAGLGGDRTTSVSAGPRSEAQASDRARHRHQHAGGGCRRDAVAAEDQHRGGGSDAGADGELGERDDGDQHGDRVEEGGVDADRVYQHPVADDLREHGDEHQRGDPAAAAHAAKHRQTAPQLATRHTAHRPRLPALRPRHHRPPPLTFTPKTTGAPIIWVEGRADELDTEGADGRCQCGVVGTRRRGRARERWDAEVGKEPFEAAWRGDRQYSRLARCDAMRMRDASREGDRVSRSRS